MRDAFSLDSPCTYMMEASTLDDKYLAPPLRTYFGKHDSLFGADRVLRLAQQLQQEVKPDMSDDRCFSDKLPVYIFKFLQKGLILSQELYVMLYFLGKDCIGYIARDGHDAYISVT